MGLSSIERILAHIGLYVKYIVAEICEKRPESSKEYCSTYQLTFFLLLYGAQIIESHAEAWVALFTAILTISTTLLWIVTRNLLRDGKIQYALSNRAFVYLDGLNHELTTASDSKIEPPERYRADPELYITRFAVQPKWKNGGNTPVKNMTIRVDWRGPQGPIPFGEYRNSPEPLFLAPKAVEHSAFIEMPGAQELVDYGMYRAWKNYLVGDDPLMFIWGRADYKDIFKQHHFVEWCYRVRFDRHDGKNLRVNFIQWGEYNRCDDD